MICFRGDCGLPMGVLPASPFYKAHLRSGKSDDRAYSSCWNRNLDFWGDDGYLPDYRWDLQKVTEYNSYQNPYVSTTVSLKTALGYAEKYSTATSNPYISILNIPPYEETSKWRYIEFSPWYQLGKAEFNKEIGVIGIVKKEELVTQIPIKLLTSNLISSIKNGAQPIDKILELSKKSYKPAFDPDAIPLFCPNCKVKQSIYLSEVLGVPGTPYFANDISVFPSHLYQNSWDFVSPYPLKTNAMKALGKLMGFKDDLPEIVPIYLDWYIIELANSGLVCICNGCNKVIYSPSIANRPMAEMKLLKYFDDKIEVEVTNNSMTEIDKIKIAVKMRYMGNIYNIVRTFGLTAFANGVTPFDVVDGYNSLKRENETLDAYIKRIENAANRTFSPNSTQKFGFIFYDNTKLEGQVEVMDVRVFSCHFESGRDWLNLSLLKEKWDFSFRNIA